MSCMRVVVRSDHEELVESVEEGLYHNKRDVRIGSVSHYLSIRARPSTPRISKRSLRHDESIANAFVGSHARACAQVT